MTYITIPIETDPEDIIATAIETIQAKFPEWEPADGNLDYWLIQAFSSASAETRDVASAVPDAIFRYFGSSLLGLPPIDEAPATTTSTWTMVDAQGYTVPAGTQVGIRASGDELVPFYVQSDVVVQTGASQTDTDSVTLIALIPGAEASGVGAALGPAELIDPLVFVQSIALTGPTSGGVDAEADDAYLNRLAELLTLLAPRPILPQDFAIMAKSVAGVHRSTALDGYNPVNNTYNNDRMVTVAMIDEVGNAVSSAVKGAVQSLLASRREVNFVVNTMDPTYTTIDVTYTVKKIVTYDSADLLAAINSALANFLSPIAWGSDASTSGQASQETWSNNVTVRYLELAQVINEVPGVDYIVSLTLRKGAVAFASSDVTLDGVVSLPHSGTFTGTIT